MLSFIILLLGLCINGRVDVYGDIDLENENYESKIAFEKKLLDGLAEQMEKDTFKELDDESKKVFKKFILGERYKINEFEEKPVVINKSEIREEKNAFENIDINKFGNFEEENANEMIDNNNWGISEEKNAIENEDSVIKCVDKNKDDFIIKVRFEIETYGVFYTMVKEFKLASIHFYWIGLKSWTKENIPLIDWKIIDNYNNFINKKLTGRKIFEVSDNEVDIFVKKIINDYDSIFLIAKSHDDWTFDLGEPIKRRVLIL